VAVRYRRAGHRFGRIQDIGPNECLRFIVDIHFCRREARRGARYPHQAG